MDYNEADMKRILNQRISTSALTEKKIREAYEFVRSDAAWRAEGEKFRSADRADGSGHFNGTQNVSAMAGKRRKPAPRRFVLLAATVGAIAALGLTAAALSGVFTKTYERQEDGLTYTFAVDYEVKPVEVDMEATYIPEGYEQQEGGALKWCADGSWQNGISLALVNAAYLDAEGSASLDAAGVKDLEETTINGMEAHVLTLDYDAERVTNTFDKRIYLFNETDGYVAVVYGGNDLSMEELKKVANGLTFTKTGETADYMSAEEKQAESEAALQADAELVAYQEYGVPQEAILTVGTTFNPRREMAQAYLEHWAQLQETADGLYDDDGEYKASLQAEQGIDITVESVELLDSIEGYPTEDFFGYEEQIAGNINADGTAKTYSRVTLENDSGEEIARDDNVERKFIEVKIKAQNLGTETVDFWAGEPQLVHLTPQEGNYAYADTYTEPLNRQEYNMEGDIGSAIYFDQTCYAGELNGHFFFRDLAAGETLEYTLLYVVDADQLEDLYLCWGYGNGNLSDVSYGIYNSRYVKLELE